MAQDAMTTRHTTTRALTMGQTGLRSSSGISIVLVLIVDDYDLHPDPAGFRIWDYSCPFSDLVCDHHRSSFSAEATQSDFPPEVFYPPIFLPFSLLERWTCNCRGEEGVRVGRKVR